MIPLNQRFAFSKLPSFLMFAEILSRSSNGRGAISTRKAMFLPETLLSLIERNAVAELELLHALPDSSDGFGALQTFENLLITFRILDDELRATVHGEHQRGDPDSLPKARSTTTLTPT
jgi:hypothetical protein